MENKQSPQESQVRGRMECPTLALNRKAEKYAMAMGEIVSGS